MLGIIVAIVVGGLAGWLASLIVDRESKGVVMNVVIGIIGAFIANGLFYLIAPNAGVNLAEPSLGGFVLAVLGAVVLLVLVNLFQGRRAINR